MEIKEQSVRAWLEHLREHSIPELLDETCMHALSSIEAQYGDIVSHGAGLEIRLGDEKRYADYIMCIDTDRIPFTKQLWYEIDYDAFLRASRTGERIEPCLFANVDITCADSEKVFWDAVLPPFLGKERAVRLRKSLEKVLAKLAKGAHVKQIGTMSGRGELDMMRLVVEFPDWESMISHLAAIGWPGDAEAFRRATEPWKETDRIAINFDIDKEGVRSKIGIEVFSRWRNPVLVDRFISGLEEAKLCLSSKADALRRWIRLRPDGAPFIQTSIHYFKLAYRDGRISEAKAYLKQSPYKEHDYFDAFRHPVWIDMELSGDNEVMGFDEACKRIAECAELPVHYIRFSGCEGYEQLDELLRTCREKDICAEVILKKNVGKHRLLQMMEAGAGSFLVDINAVDGSSLFLLKTLCRTGFTRMRARWFLHSKNISKLEKAFRLASRLGASEFIVSGRNPRDPALKNPMDCEQIDKAAGIIRSWLLSDGEAQKHIKVFVESCFSQLLAYIGGEDPKQNPNRGIERGCEAGRAFMAVRADGTLSPCLFLEERERWEKMKDYWEASSSLKNLREKDMPDVCKDCCYRRRCRPCPVAVEKELCPVHKIKKLSYQITGQ